MHADHLAPMVDDLCSLGRLGADILTACNAKEDLLDLLALARTHPDRRAIAERLHRFYTRCAEAGLPELERLATTVEAAAARSCPRAATSNTSCGARAPRTYCPASSAAVPRWIRQAQRGRRRRGHRTARHRPTPPIATRRRCRTPPRGPPPPCRTSKANHSTATPTPRTCGDAPTPTGSARASNYSAKAKRPPSPRCSTNLPASTPAKTSASWPANSRCGSMTASASDRPAALTPGEQNTHIEMRNEHCQRVEQSQLG